MPVHGGNDFYGGALTVLNHIAGSANKASWTGPPGLIPQVASDVEGRRGRLASEVVVAVLVLVVAGGPGNHGRLEAQGMLLNLLSLPPSFLKPCLKTWVDLDSVPT